MSKIIIDLSMEIYDGAPTMPMDPKCSVSEHCNLDSLGYNLSRITMSTHQGTHLDAPYHFFYEGNTVDKLDLSKCMGTAIKIDLDKKAGEAVTVDDFLSYEDKITEGSFVIYGTGWDKHFPKPEYFSKFPYMTKELAGWLAKKKVGLIGMDTPTPNGADWKYIHETLLSAKIVIVEGLANIGKIPAEEFMFIGLPLKIKGRDGSPIRAVAVVDK